MDQVLSHLSSFFSGNFEGIALTVFGVIVLLGAKQILSALLKLLSAETENKYLARFYSFVKELVLSAQQTIVDEKKKALADGVITKEEMETVYKEVKDSVVKKAKEMISQWPLFAQFLVEDKVEDFVESAVKKVKNEGKTINPS